MIDFQAAVIDGALPRPVLDRLIRRITQEMHGLDLSGIAPPQILPGSLGPVARALGGASFPLFDRYLLDMHAISGTSRLR